MYKRFEILILCIRKGEQHQWEPLYETEKIPQLIKSIRKEN